MKNISVLFASAGLFLGLVSSSCNDPQLLAPGGDNEIKGCTNQEAVNYNSEAAVDDGSCVVVNEQQNSIFVKFTATWCGPCGGWGGTAFTDAIATQGSRMLAMSLQVNDDLTTGSNGPLVDEFSNKWNYSGTPNFAANEIMVGTTVQDAVNEVADHAQLMPKLGVGVRTTLGAGPNAGKLNIDAYIKHFDETNDDYHLAIYFLARNIVASQNTSNGYVDNYEHHHVLLGAATYGGAYGEEIITEKKSAGDVTRFARAVAYDASWDLDELEVVAVVWRKDPSLPNTFYYENSTTNR